MNMNEVVVKIPRNKILITVARFLNYPYFNAKFTL